MRGFTCILFLFVFILLGNSVYGSDEKRYRLQESGEGPRTSRANRPINQAVMNVNPQRGSTYHHGGVELPLLHSDAKHPPRLASLEELQKRTYAQINLRPPYAIKNPNAPPALLSEHYPTISPGSLITVMIEGKQDVHVGELYEESEWPVWVFTNSPRVPFRPALDEAYILVVDPYAPTKKLAAKLQFYRQCDSPRSQIFITNGAHVYHAPLTYNQPNRDNHPSTVHILFEMKPKTYVGLHGALKVWGASNPVPDWVLRERTSWL
ncbi:uncharacterized protein LOC117168223 [Belonocnema kinseyi]|uniref:uncharacterized protein LOC117168223 n=1 Tax=Belonocnema kinseyi TaxID=2817044 RepID=UPI00143D7A71|nr:uncharacterized protein LOC117168223 [Belonocnema kinseyi]